MSANRAKLRKQHSIVVIELDAQRHDDKSGKPYVYVTSSSQLPETLFTSLESQYERLSLPGKPVRLRQELVLKYKPSRSKTAIERRLKETKERLNKLGYQVEPHWRVYVLDVDPENPEPLLDRGERNHVIYVGQTSNEIETRLLQHQGVLRGKHGKFLGAPSIEGRSPRINAALTPDERAFSEDDALTLETKYAKKFKDLGYRVLGDGLTDPAKRKRLT